MVLGRPIVDLLNAIEVCGREAYPDVGRAPGPRLLEKLPIDVFRDETEVAREETEDVDEGLRMWLLFCVNIST
jgi:hypothetical protein